MSLRCGGTRSTESRRINRCCLSVGRLFPSSLAEASAPAGFVHHRPRIISQMNELFQNGAVAFSANLLPGPVNRLLSASTYLPRVRTCTKSDSRVNLSTIFSTSIHPLAYFLFRSSAPESYCPRGVPNPPVLFFFACSHKDRAASFWSFFIVRSAKAASSSFLVSTRARFLPSSSLASFKRASSRRARHGQTTEQRHRLFLWFSGTLTRQSHVYRTSCSVRFTPRQYSHNSGSAPQVGIRHRIPSDHVREKRGCLFSCLPDSGLHLPIQRISNAVIHQYIYYFPLYPRGEIQRTTQTPSLHYLLLDFKTAFGVEISSWRKRLLCHIVHQPIPFNFRTAQRYTFYVLKLNPESVLTLLFSGYSVRLFQIMDCPFELRRTSYLCGRSWRYG